MNDSFTGFSQGDFAAFVDSKKENGLFNSERKTVWKKVKELQKVLEPELRRRGFPFEGKISQYWINHTKRHVNGIWLAYTDIAPYYKVCQLNCGIYRNGFFAGIEINSKASEHLKNVAEYIHQNKEEFISVVSELDSRYFCMNYGEWKADLPNLFPTNLDELVDVMHNERNWLEVGEWYPRQESFLSSHEFVSKIPKIFETLFPLYLVFAGQRPLGNSTKDKLLRANDVRRNDLQKIEKILSPEMETLTPGQWDELIRDIDKRNKIEAPKRQGRNTETFRRNPVLSLALKRKYRDKCQVCGLNLKVNRGLFCDTHHVKPLGKGGLDISENILVLCPSHHRFFDRSNYEMISKDNSLLVVKVNRQILRIAF